MTGNMDVPTILEIAGNAAAVIATLAAVWAAQESRRAANASLAATEGTLVLDFMKEYFGSEMNGALQTLRYWKESHGDAFAVKWVEAMKTHDPDALSVDIARRTAKGFYERAVRLFSAELVRERAFREMVYTAGLNLYYDIVVPLDHQKNAHRSVRTDEVLKRRIGRYKEGTPGF